VGPENKGSGDNGLIIFKIFLLCFSHKKMYRTQASLRSKDRFFWLSDFNSSDSNRT